MIRIEKNVKITVEPMDTVLNPFEKIGKWLLGNRPLFQIFINGRYHAAINYGDSAVINHTIDQTFPDGFSVVENT